MVSNDNVSAGALASSLYRSEIAALKRRLEDLERQLRKASKVSPATTAAATDDESIAEGTRFSAKSVASQRRGSDDLKVQMEAFRKSYSDYLKLLRPDVDD